MSVKVGVAHPGTQHSWQTAIAFQKATWLEWYATNFYYKPDRFPDRLAACLPAQVHDALDRELRRRRCDAIDDAKVRRRLTTEPLERLLRVHVSRHAADRLARARYHDFSPSIERLMGKERVDLLWAPVDCLGALERARAVGSKAILDQPIGNLRELQQVLLQEHDRNPEFFPSAFKGLGTLALARQDQAVEVADAIVVGSPFAALTMQNHGAENVHVIPYGFDPGLFPSQPPDRGEFGARPVEFVFVGQVGPRKGAAYLLKAFQQIPPEIARLTIIGPLDMPEAVFRRNSPNVRYLGQLRRPEIAQKLREADCMIMPSLFEGSALVLYEAIGAGLPIIQSHQSGIGAIDGETGAFLSIVNTDQLLDVIWRVISNPEILTRWAANTWMVRDNHTWDGYHHAVHQLSSKLLDA